MELTRTNVCACVCARVRRDALRLVPRSFGRCSGPESPRDLVCIQINVISGSGPVMSAELGSRAAHIMYVCVLSV